MQAVECLAFDKLVEVEGERRFVVDRSKTTERAFGMNRDVCPNQISLAHGGGNIDPLRDVRAAINIFRERGDSYLGNLDAEMADARPTEQFGARIVNRAAAWIFVSTKR